MDNSELAARMKDFYENPAKTQLLRRMPVAIRLDGKAFHTFTRGFQKPFDPVLMDTMQRTMKYLCENIQGCVFGYTQSDEITLILTDYQKLTSEAWFNYEVQKMASISASMATVAFNKYFSENIIKYNSTYDPLVEENKRLIERYVNAAEKGAIFDARCFNIPKEEVTNLIYWRQLDATRNSIQMVGQAHFSHAELKDKTCSDIQDMLMTQYGINWNVFTIPCKRGTACIKVEEKETIKEPNVYFGEQIGERIIVRRKWKIDYEIPIFKGADRDYIDKLIFIEPIA
jgi:tRNA(His) 5'-end guanylyltransferase